MQQMIDDRRPACVRRSAVVRQRCFGRCVNSKPNL